MSSKRAFLVLAPESHGSHLVTDILVHGGCHGASGEHAHWKPDEWELGPEDEKPWEAVHATDVQPWDREPPTDQDPIVWRRSVPHGGAWLDLRSLVRPLRGAGYLVRAIVVTRDRHAAVGSQLKWHHAASAEEARANISRAYGEIFGQLASLDLPFLVTSYEALTLYPGARAALLAELGLDAERDLEVWDGNRKWYADSTHAPEERDDRSPASPIDTGFPEAWFPAPGYVAQEYEKRVRLGREHMRDCRIVFGGIARDVETALPGVLARIDKVGESLREHAFVVYENDSRDGTARVLTERARASSNFDATCETLQAPAYPSDRSAARMEHLSACRNRVLDRVLERFADFDYFIALDLDLPRGFSYDGLASTFGYGGWDWMGSNGISAPLTRRAVRAAFHYDAWAFRWPGDDTARPAEELNALRFHRGAPPTPVWSCFGGLAAYRMEAVRSGARYSGGDCEHVAFHRALRERGHAAGYLNPSLFVLYSGQQR